METIQAELWELNRTKMIQLLNEVGTPEQLIQSVCRLVDNTDYFYAPASTKFHGARPGGLFDHSFGVAKQLLEWEEKGITYWGRSWSPVLVGLLHDFTKVGKYRLTDDLRTADGPYDYEYTPYTRYTSYGGHGEDSCIKVMKVVPLTDEELACIRWHMGPYEGKQVWDLYDAAAQKEPNVLWTHHADMVVSKLLGV